MKILKNKKILLSIGIAIMVHSFANAQITWGGKNIPQIPFNSQLEFGVGFTKEVNAGKICYGCFVPESLNIVGGGTSAPNRKITIWSEGGTTHWGNFGIGTQYPTAKLQISVPAGNSANPDRNGIYVFNENNTSGNDAIIAARVGGSWAGNPFISLDVAGESGWAVGVDNSDSNKFKISNSWSSLTNKTNLTIDQTGNVGIGTINPTQKLEVNGGVRIQDDIFKPNNGSGITWGSNFSKIKDDGNLNILTDDSFYIGKCDGAGNRTATTIFADVNSGNVGIGTESPTQKLEVNGGVRIQDDIFKPNNGSGITWGSNYSKIKDNGHLNILTDDFFFIGKCDGDGNRTATTILADVNSGNVGIGTENPTAKLMVNGRGGQTIDFQTTGRMKILSDVAGTFLADQNNNNKAFYGYDYTIPNHAFGIWTPSEGWSAFNILQNGNVGIGTKNPTQKLEVNGNAIINGTVGIGRPAASDIQLAVKGSFNVTNSSNNTVFHVSSGKELVFVGTDAYTKFQSAAATGAINTNLFSLWVSKGVSATDFAMSDITAWNDFVFDTEYKLPTLSETADYILKNKHLPYIPSEKEVIEKGYSVHKLNRGFLQTIEEMTLHAIAQEKTIATQEQKINTQEQKMNEQEAKLINLSQELAEIKALLQNKK